MELKRRFAQEQKSEPTQPDQPQDQIDIDSEIEMGMGSDEEIEQREDEISATPSRQITYKRHSAIPLAKVGVVLVIIAGLALGWHSLPARLGIDQQTTVAQPKQTTTSSSQESKSDRSTEKAVQPNLASDTKQASQIEPIKKQASTPPSNVPKADLNSSTPSAPAASPQSQEQSEEQTISESTKPKARSEQMQRHTVVAGETLYRISMNYYRSRRYVDFLARYNHLTDPASLVVGTTILIPFPPVQ
jgi:LysM repeat protein